MQCECVIYVSVRIGSVPSSVAVLTVTVAHYKEAGRLDDNGGIERQALSSVCGRCEIHKPVVCPKSIRSVGDIFRLSFVDTVAVSALRNFSS